MAEKDKAPISDAEKSPHHHETHGMSDDIDENTQIDEVKGPNVFERVKEEIVALVEAIHPKKESDDSSSKWQIRGGFHLSC